jgi:hypothetical protein
MRFNRRHPEIGDERVVERFAWSPVTVRTEMGAETRWLERVRVVETFTEFKGGDRWWPTGFLEPGKSR